MTAHYALFGHPVAHSLSPRIHKAFARQLGVDMDYRAVDVDATGLAQALSDFAAQGGKGANITLPHKEAVVAVCAQLSERARRAGAVNTLTRKGGHWHGDNTDGIGLIHHLTERLRLDLRGRRVLLLGAGGAARGVAPALLDAGIDELFIVNRSPEKADALADRLGEPGRVHSRYWNDLRNLGVFDMVVNATSAGRSDGALQIPFALVTPRSSAVDLSYGDAAIGFLAWARTAKCHEAVDGLGMLIEQAAESFAIWHGQRPDTDELYEELGENSPALHAAD